MDTELKGKTALVTGASSGLGVDFARQLAQHGMDVILVARRLDLLQSVAEKIERDFNVSAWAIPADLADSQVRQELYQHIHAEGRQVDVLVNNAGFGVYGNFVDVPWEREQQMLELDIIAMAHLTKLFIKDMLQRNSGYILMVASIGAYQPSPTYASYSAAKAYVLNLGEALNFELRHSGVSVTVVSPGVTATEFLKVSGQEPTLYQRLMMMQSTDVVRIAIESMLKRKPSVVPGIFNALFTWGNRLISRRMSAQISYWFMTYR